MDCPFGFKYYQFDERGHIFGSNNQIVWKDFGHPRDIPYTPLRTDCEQWNKVVDIFEDFLEDE